MTKLEYLAQIGKLKTKIQRMQERIEEYRCLAQSPATAGYGERVKSSPKGEAPFVKWIYKVIELEKETERLQSELQTLQATIINAIEQLENEDFKTLLVCRYLQGMSWEKVAAKLFVTEWTVYRWNKQALNLLKLPNL